jgi:hypothetical protein
MKIIEQYENQKLKILESINKKNNELAQIEKEISLLELSCVNIDYEIRKLKEK